MNINTIMNTVSVLGISLILCLIARAFGIELDLFSVGVFIFLGIVVTYLSAINHNIVQCFFFVLGGGKDGEDQGKN